MIQKKIVWIVVIAPLAFECENLPFTSLIGSACDRGVSVAAAIGPAVDSLSFANETRHELAHRFFDDLRRRWWPGVILRSVA
jgi:hypothetical protein